MCLKRLNALTSSMEQINVHTISCSCAACVDVLTTSIDQLFLRFVSLLKRQKSISVSIKAEICAAGNTNQSAPCRKPLGVISSSVSWPWPLILRPAMAASACFCLFVSPNVCCFSLCQAVFYAALPDFATCRFDRGVDIAMRPLIFLNHKNLHPAFQ